MLGECEFKRLYSLTLDYRDKSISKMQLSRLALVGMGIVKVETIIGNGILNPIVLKKSRSCVKEKAGF